MDALSHLSPARNEQSDPPHPIPEGRLLGILGLCGFSSTFAMRLIDPLVPTLAGVFMTPVATIATLVTAYGLAYALGQPLIGALGDALGKVRTIAVAGLCLSVLLLVSSVVATFDQLFLLRCLSGVAGGGLIPVAMAALADRVPYASRQVVLARFIMFVTLGQMAGAAGAGAIGAAFGWRAPFVAASIVALAGALLVLVVLKPRPSAQRSVSLLGGALTGYRQVFANPATLPTLLLAVIEGALLFGLIPFVAAILAERAGVGPAEAGLVIAGGGLGAMLYGGLVGRLVARFGQSQLPLAGGFVAAAAFLLFAIPLPWWTGPLIFILQGFGFMLMHNALQLRATELAPEARSSSVAVFAASLFSGQALGPLAMGLLPHTSERPYGLIVFAVGLILLGIAIARVVAQRPR